MARYIAHVFPSRADLKLYQLRARDSDSALRLHKAGRHYVDRDGDVHLCFAVREREDVHDWLAYSFQATELHGSFGHLDPDDYAYMLSMLNSRVRPAVPEVANG